MNGPEIVVNGTDHMNHGGKAWSKLGVVSRMTLHRKGSHVELGGQGAPEAGCEEIVR